MYKLSITNHRCGFSSTRRPDKDGLVAGELGHLVGFIHNEAFANCLRRLRGRKRAMPRADNWFITTLAQARLARRRTRDREKHEAAVPRPATLRCALRRGGAGTTPDLTWAFRAGGAATRGGICAKPMTAR